MADDRQQIKGWQSTIRNLLCWAFASLVAIAILQINALLGLVVAVIGGILLGVLLFK